MRTLEFVVTLCTFASLATYSGAFVLLLRGRRAGGLSFFAAGWLINAAMIVLNGIACGHPPFGNMYHVLVFLAFCFFPLYLLMHWRHEQDFVHVYFAFAACVPLLGTLFMDRNLMWRRMPALQSPWFVPHVVSYVISYAFAAVAFAITVGGWLARKPAGIRLIDHVYRSVFATRTGACPGEAVLPPHIETDGRHETASHRILRIAFPFMTFGMLSGALWAEEAWGVYWSWDAKETWSLITWTLYVIYFHCHLRPPLRRYTAAAQTAAFAALLSTFLLVNLWPRIGSILHSYA
jgi:cytochrome c-type biogenesis protein CcsB